MEYLENYKMFEKKKYKIKRLSEEEHEKEIQKGENVAPNDGRPLAGVKTDDANEPPAIV